MPNSSVGKGLERSSEADEDAPQWNANQEQSKICQRPRYSDMAVLSTRNKTSHHHGSRGHEKNPIMNASKIPN